MMGRTFPIVMGTIMGVIMPFMAHGLGGQALLWFVVVHVVVIGALIGAALAMAHWLGAVPRWLPAHRPSGAHLAQMGLGAAIGFSGLHLWAHGLEGIA